MDYLSNLFHLKDKVSVITGGGGVLASKMAEGFLKAGAKVILLDLHQENLRRKIEILSEIDKDVLGLECNVLDEDRLKDTNEKILQKYGRIDILVNAAGGNMTGATIGIDQDFFDLKIDAFREVTDLNLNGTVLPTLIFAKVMAEHKSGSIINISSMAVHRAITRVVGYSAAKAGIDNFTRWLAVEMALKFSNSIRVNAIAPGFLLTEQNRTLLTQADGSLTERGKTIIQNTPFKRFGEPEELVGTVLWLASDAARFVTGTVIPIDGGFSIFSRV